MNRFRIGRSSHVSCFALRAATAAEIEGAHWRPNMSKKSRWGLLPVIALISCSGGGGSNDKPPPPPPAASGMATSLGASGRMSGGAITADVVLGAPFGAQGAAGGTVTMTEPVLGR